MNITRWFAALKAARSVPQYIKQCRVIVGKMPSGAGLGSPPIPYATVTAHLNALDELEQASHKGPVGAATDRNAALFVVQTDMRLLKAFLESVANTSANPQGLIEDSGFSVTKKTVPSKQDITAKWGANAGTVLLLAKAVKKTRRVQYMWQMSADSKTWTNLPTTLRASTLVGGLTAGTVYYFRVQNQTVAALSDWSAIVSIMAH